MTKIIITFLIGLTLISCVKTKVEKDNYPNIQTISNNQGIPNDSNSFYIPTSIQIDTITTITGSDPFMQTWFSSTLYAAEEPILFNYYLGHDIYRFLWLRSFHRPVVFTIHKNKNEFWLITKMLDKVPDFSVPLQKKPKFKVKIKDNSNYESPSIDNTDPIPTIQTKGEAKLILNEKKALSEAEWKEFESRLNNASFWTSIPLIRSEGLDGSEWIIEAHLKYKYWLIIRWSPEDNFRKAGEYLIEKSGLNEMIY